MSKLMISALDDNQNVTGFFMVISRSLRPLRNKTSSFLVLGLADRSGEIEAKLWENGEELFQKIHEQDVVKIQGKTQIYNGNLELILERARVAHEDEFQLEDFLPATERDVDQMVKELRHVVDRVENGHLNALLQAFFAGDGLDDFCLAPAAKKIHHAYLGGLLEHTLEVVRHCETCLELYPTIDRDLLIAGALLHDIGKVREYLYRRRIDFSDEGRLLGHIVLGEQMLVEKAATIDGFPDDILLKLRHMLISHHGQYEWQSPKRPKTIEACVLHQADYFSGQVAIFFASIKASAESGSAWTSYNRFLERAIYVGAGVPNLANEDAVEGYHRVMEERDYIY